MTEAHLGRQMAALAASEGHVGKAPFFRGSQGNEAIGPRSLAVLRLAARKEGSPTGAALAREIGDKSCNVSSIIGQLVVRNLIFKRYPDRKKLRIFATVHGKKYLREMEGGQ